MSYAPTPSRSWNDCAQLGSPYLLPEQQDTREHLERVGVEGGFRRARCRLTLLLRCCRHNWFEDTNSP